MLKEKDFVRTGLKPFPTDNIKFPISPLLPLRDIVLFPKMVVPLYVLRQKSTIAIEKAYEGNKKIIAITQKDMNKENPKEADLYHYGTVGEVLQLLRIPDGSIKVLIEGNYRIELLEFIASNKYYQGKYRKINEQFSMNKDLEVLMRSVIRQFETYIELNPKIPSEIRVALFNVFDPLFITDTISANLMIRIEEKQKLLEIFDVKERLILLMGILDKENEILAMEQQLMEKVKHQIGKTQKEYFLNEQLKVIEQELGINESEDSEITDFSIKIKKVKMSKEAEDKAHKELSRFEKMAALSPEATVSRTYLEWFTELPWAKQTKDKIDLEKAEKILNEDHYGLEEVKERILEHLAVNRMVKNIKGPILCFVGPPGVGKTSLAKSIARALGRRFVRVSLGGVRDEAEIRGHRRTYIGALPGKIVLGMRKAGTINPVFLMDEVDKMSADFHGDPASALLEVLDPEQNKGFVDHYLEVEYDLSKVMFITTANTFDGIPYPLLDRMEVITIEGYTEDDKIQIAQQFLVPKQLKSHGLKKSNLVFKEEALKLIINGYTKESGVRNLEKQIQKICRKVVRIFVASKNKIKKEVIDEKKVQEYLGYIKYKDMEVISKNEIGVVNGLAWTEVGGELLSTETTVMKGRGNLLLTGKLGEVMQESAKAALSYIRSRYKDFNISPNFYKNYDIHIHIPEGAIPKDGPSAGITMATSMISALSKRPVKNGVAMTGEITLRGKILKIGGLKEKILAAKRNNIHIVLIPSDNKDELESLSPKLKEDMRIVLVNNMEDVLKFVFNKHAKR